MENVTYETSLTRNKPILSVLTSVLAILQPILQCKVNTSIAVLVLTSLNDVVLSNV